MVAERSLLDKHGRDLGLLLLRLGFGAGMVYHGWGKIFGNMEGFVQLVAGMGFPAPALFAWAAALSELLGGIGLLLGLYTRWSAAAVLTTMTVATLVYHLGDPFPKKEKALAYLVAALCLLLAGAGRLSVDGTWFSPRNDPHDD